MAKPTNTIDRYDANRAVRESLSDIIYNIAPDETPFMSNIGRGKAANTYFEWQTDTLAAANKDNAAIEGDDATIDNRPPTSRVGNYTQISRKVVATTGTVEAVSKAGIKQGMLAYELSKASAELKTDMEAALTSNNPAVVGNSTTARKTAGFAAFLRTNVDKAAAGVNPTLSATTDGYPNAGRTAGTARAFTETILKNVLKQTWTSGGKLKLLMTGPFNKTVVSGFPGIAQNRVNVNGAKPSVIIGAADIYVSDFGNVAVVPNRFQPESYAFVVDPDYASVEYLRDFQTSDLAKTGDSQKKMLLVEYGLKVNTEKAHGIAADLLTA